MLALVGVAAAALGTGFLAQEEIMINLQGLGVGVELVSLPLSDVWIDLTVTKITSNTENVISTEGDEFSFISDKTIFINLVDKCSFHYSETDSQLPPFPDNNLGPGSQVICKLSDEEGDVVAEGRIIANQGPNQPNPDCPEEQWALRNAAGALLDCVDYIPASQTWQIPMQTWACADEECTKVGWVNDVEIVVLGNFSGKFNAP